MARRQPTAEDGAQALREATRLQELKQFVPASDVAEQCKVSFERFLLGRGVTGLLAASDRDVVSFLMSKDATGRTKVHNESCPREAGGMGCACPLRAAAGSLDSTRGILRGVYRDLGVAPLWNPSSGTGNPCQSKLVGDYVQAVAGEQAAAGLTAKQAPLLDESVYAALMACLWERWMACDLVEGNEASAREAVEVAQELLLYALLWATGLRGGDALRLLAVNVEVYAGDTPSQPGGLYVWVGRSKTVRAPKDGWRVTTTDTGSHLEPMRALQALLKSAARVRLPVLQGKLFRYPVYVPVVDACAHARWGVQWAKDRVDRAFALWLTRAGLPSDVKLHSFRGSRAYREKMQGIPPKVTCAAMGNWTLKMYERYTGNRVPLSIKPAARVFRAVTSTAGVRE